MKIITLTTDFGLKDHYAAALKGTLFSGNSQVTVVDVSHQVPPGDILQAAFILRNSFREFPLGSIHLLTVGASLSGRYRHVALLLDGHYFIGCDNGVFSLLSEKRPEHIVEIASGSSSTFMARDVYVPAALKLAAGEPLENLGPQTDAIFEKMLRRHPPENDVIKGSISYIDAFGNLITDISITQFDLVGQKRSFRIDLIGDEITRISRQYSDVVDGEKLAFFNSAGFLEIAINQGKASALLSLKLYDIVRIEFGV